MHSDTSHIQCSTHEQFLARFMELDSFHRPASYGEVFEIEARFHAMARTYALRSPALRNWIGNGNTLPEVYR